MDATMPLERGQKEELHPHAKRKRPSRASFPIRPPRITMSCDGGPRVCPWLPSCASKVGWRAPQLRNASDLVDEACEARLVCPKGQDLAGAARNRDGRSGDAASGAASPGSIQAMRQPRSRLRDRIWWRSVSIDIAPSRVQLRLTSAELGSKLVEFGKKCAMLFPASL